MRLIVLLTALLLVGLLINQQMNIAPEINEELERESALSVDLPKLPNRPQDVKGFDQQLNTFMKKSESERAQQIERAQQ